MNQPPLTQKQSGKRIVSKGRYVARVGKKVILASGGVILYLLGLAGFVFLLLLLCFASLNLRHPLEIGFFITLTAFIAMIAAGAVYVGRRTLHKGEQLDTGVPLTRANTAALPAPDSLVRASQEPTQAQEAVLLRAASQGQGTPAEELVRASVGQEPTSNIEKLPLMAKTTKRDAKGRFASHALYFSGWGYDESQDTTLRYQGENVCVVEVAGQPLRLRMDSYLYFRHLDDADERASLMMFKSVLPYFGACASRRNITERFTQYYTAHEYGRCLLYVSDYMRPDQCLFLCFAPEGSGFCRETNGLQLDFRWQEATTLQWQELLTANPEDIKPLCTRIFEEQVHSRMTNKFLALIGVTPADCVDEPHQFLCGSEDELRRITTYIMQTQAGLFESNSEPVTITYWALTRLNRTDRVRVERGWNRDLAQGRILALCNLALQYNVFVGVKWWPPHYPNPTRIAELQAEAWKIKSIVHPPSAHERAEAILALSEWLDGKVTPEEKRALLQLPDDVEV